MTDDDLLLLNNIPEELPYWTNLGFHQCPNCALDSQENAHCPTAVHYVKLLPILQDVMSYEEIYVKVITPQRITLQKISAQKAVSSIMDLINATSGCPHTIFFRPMARFHLPFSNAYETTYRVTSMYLLAQYFLLKQGQGIDLELQGLKQMYSNIQMIDESMIDRLRFASEKDVAINALTNLDSLAKIVQMSIDESLEEIRHFFRPYFNKIIANIWPDRRSEQRAKQQVPLYVCCQERHFIADTVDLSEKELCIRVSSELLLNVGNDIDIAIADQRVKAKVAWVKRLPDKSLVGLQKS